MAQGDTYSGAVSTLPPSDSNQVRQGNVRSNRDRAVRIAEFHRRGLRRRRQRDVTCEMYMLHIDGEADAQWAALYNGERIVTRAGFSGQVRSQENLLKPVVTHAVAQHTTMEFRFIAQGKPDRESRERALMDAAFANYLVQKIRLNRVFAQAMWMAMPWGFCPVHAFWRNDFEMDVYEPLYDIQEEELRGAMQRGMIDAWVGDPGDTLYPAGSTIGSVGMYQYGRTLPAGMVRSIWPQHRLEGSDKLPSRSKYQRAKRQWNYALQDIHGTSVLQSGQGSEEDELIAIICRETEPGIDPNFPDGRLEICALNGAATTLREEGTGGGDPVYLHDGPLPGGVLSSVNVYSDYRFDDILGNPWVADLDDHQVQLNQAIAEVTETLRRASRPRFYDAGGLSEDSLEYEYDVRIEGNPLDRQVPFYVEYPTGHIPYLKDLADQHRQAIFLKGGYNAASRGELNPGDSGRKILAAARADDTIHGPVNALFRSTVEEWMGKAWSLFKEYADVPWVIEVVGDEMGYLASTYLDNTKVSEDRPTFILTSSYGATPEAKGEQLLQLVQTLGADGQPLMSTDQFRKQWPDKTTYPVEDDGAQLRKLRARTINQKIREMVPQFQQHIQQRVQFDPAAAEALRAVQQVLPLAIHVELSKADPEFKVLPDDDPGLHLKILGDLSQDPTEDPLVREVARVRQTLYHARLVGMMAPGTPQASGIEGLVGGGGGGATRRGPGGGGEQSKAVSQMGDEGPGHTANERELTKASRRELAMIGPGGI